MKIKRNILLAALCVLMLSGAAMACPMCKDSIPNSDAAQAGSLPSGFNNSVYLLLIGFMTMTAFMTGVIIKAVHDTGIKPAGFPVNPAQTPPTKQPPTTPPQS